jgi:hypothetical protein
MGRRSGEPLGFEPDYLVEDNALNRWGFGAAAPLALLCAGMCFIVRETVSFTVGRHGNYPITLTGFDAAAVGLLFIFGAAYLHLHCWWAISPRLSYYAEGGKMLALLGVVISFSYCIFASIRYMWDH